MKNLAASIHDRLLNLSRSKRQDFGALLDRYCVERLLYRLASSQHSERFVLKGAQLLLVHSGEPHRPTRDVDLLGFGSDDLRELARTFREVCATDVPPDGLVFDAATVDAEAIREDAEYGGVRVKLLAHLGSARIRLQVDIGFGDVITPEAEIVEYPPLFDGPAVRLRGYPLATVVAEKVESLVQLGLATTRMKDLYDLWYILKEFPVETDEVRLAILRTFGHRNTPLDPQPVVFTSVFWDDVGKRAQWQAFTKRSRLEAMDLWAVCSHVASALAPLLVEES